MAVEAAETSLIGPAHAESMKAWFAVQFPEQAAPTPGMGQEGLEKLLGAVRTRRQALELEVTRCRQVERTLVGLMAKASHRGIRALVALPGNMAGQGEVASEAAREVEEAPGTLPEHAPAPAPGARGVAAPQPAPSPRARSGPAKDRCRLVARMVLV